MSDAVEADTTAPTAEARRPRRRVGRWIVAVVVLWLVIAGVQIVVGGLHARAGQHQVDAARGKSSPDALARGAPFLAYTHPREFDPDSWWQTRGGQRTEAVESQKLLIDVLRHPF